MDLADLIQDHNPWWRDAALRRARRYPLHRVLGPEIHARLLREDERRAVVLLGPRQVGKTVLLLQLADSLLDAGWPPANLTYFDFSDDRLSAAVSARDVVALPPIARDTDLPQILLLDEIRLATRWDRWLKQAVDQGGSRIVATDSAVHLLRAGSAESGQGRWDEIVMEGLSFREFGRFNLGIDAEPDELLRRAPNLHEIYLSLGGFPEHVRSEDFPEVRRRLRSDIVDRAILRDLGGLGVDLARIKALFLYLVQDSGAAFNAESRARDLHADPRTVREWARLLEETLLIAALPRWTRQPSARLRSQPKLFAVDPGLMAAFASTPIQERPVRGRLFEIAVFRHLRETARGLGGELSYFRDQREDLELDFVLSSPGSLVGVEVTSSAVLRPDKIHRVQSAGEALGADRVVLVHGGRIDQDAGRVRAVALPQFLADPARSLRRSLA
jgi:predicted AAA+ superfamily ATPase